MSSPDPTDPFAGVVVARPAAPRLRFWPELLFVLFGYWCYTLVRNSVPDQARAATRHAEEILGWQRAIGVDIELTVNQAFDRITWLIVGLNYYYAIAHFAVTIGVLAWLFRHYPHHYRPARTIFLVTNGCALVFFYLYPLAPPRLLPGEGYVDTVITHGTWGSFASGDIAAVSNQYAAMPSMHVAWSVFCAIIIFALARRWWVRALGVVHPALTVLVIIATGNHFVLDAVGGIVTLVAGYALTRGTIAVWRRQRREPDRVAALGDEREPDPAGAAA
jgi:hypothetical protein